MEEAQVLLLIEVIFIFVWLLNLRQLLLALSECGLQMHKLQVTLLKFLSESDEGD